jgi:lipopolysaccharide assembly protein A
MDLKSRLRLAGAVVLATVAIVVIFQNAEPAPVKFLFMTVTMPRAALLAITLLIGFVLGVVFAFFVRKGK